MIPKIIHYVWFGDKSFNKLQQKCFKSWFRYCSDFKFMKWDENNFDVNMFEYTKEAFKKKQWAFLSDVVRLYALIKYGGVYLDTDVELIKPLDPFLDAHAFSGFEDGYYLQTGIMGCEPNYKLFINFLKKYKHRNFIKCDGTMDQTTNAFSITKYLYEFGLKRDDTYQVINGLKIYPHDYFCPKNYFTSKIFITNNSICIHHFSESWKKYNFFKKTKIKIKKIIKKIIK